MLFKDLKQGYSIYVLDRNKVEFSTGKVKNVGMSRMDNRVGVPTDMVVDIDIEVDGATKSLVLKDSNDSAYYNEFMFSTSKDSILRELDVIMMQSEDALSKVEQYKANIEKCKSIRLELNPAEKEKKVFDDRLNKVESIQERIESKLDALLKELKI